MNVCPPSTSFMLVPVGIRLTALDCEDVFSSGSGEDVSDEESHVRSTKFRLDILVREGGIVTRYHCSVS